MALRHFLCVVQGGLRPLIEFLPHLAAFQNIARDVMQAPPADMAANRLGIDHAPLQYHFKGQVGCQIAGCAGLAHSTSSLCLQELLEEHGTLKNASYGVPEGSKRAKLSAFADSLWREVSGCLSLRKALNSSACMRRTWTQL